MRTTTISGFTINYPEDIIWVSDHTALTVSASFPVGATVNIIHPQGEVKTLTYMSPLNELTFYLDTALRTLHNDNIGDYQCQVLLYNNNNYATTFSFYFKLYDGKSFQDRTHGNSQYIYLYEPDEAIKVNFYSPSNGTAVIGNSTFTITKGLNSLNLSSIITTAGTYQICFHDTSNETLNVWIISDTPVDPYDHELTFTSSVEVQNAMQGGDIFSKRTIFPICHTIELVERCPNYSSVELIYTDCDGCRRYLAGNIITDTSSVSRTGYTNLDESVYKDVPRATLIDGSQLVKIGFSDIDLRANYRDILYSENLYIRRNYDDEPIPVRLKTDSLAVQANEEYADFELEIYYMD